MAYPGKIGECRVGNQVVLCPGQINQLTTEKLDLLPQIPSWAIHNDFLFTVIVSVVTVSFVGIAILKVKIFGKALGEYIKPIWPFMLASVLVVFWQYLFGLRIENNSLPLRISQWLWELMVAASVYKVSKFPDVNYGQMFFLGVIYSFVIHGLKVTIRYFFYGKTLLYIVDRFLYGSLLVMLIAFAGGSLWLYFKRKGILRL